MIAKKSRQLRPRRIKASAVWWNLKLNRIEFTCADRRRTSVGQLPFRGKEAATLQAATAQQRWVQGHCAKTTPASSVVPSSIPVFSRDLFVTDPACALLSPYSSTKLRIITSALAYFLSFIHLFQQSRSLLRHRELKMMIENACI